MLLVKRRRCPDQRGGLCFGARQSCRGRSGKDVSRVCACPNVLSEVFTIVNVMPIDGESKSGVVVLFVCFATRHPLELAVE